MKKKKKCYVDTPSYIWSYVFNDISSDVYLIFYEMIRELKLGGVFGDNPGTIFLNSSMKTYVVGTH